MAMIGSFDLISQPLRAASFPSRGSLSSEVRGRLLRVKAPPTQGRLSLRSHQRTAGVREYWIVNPMTRIVQVYCFGEPEDSTQYSFDEEISVGIYNDLKICITDLLK